MSCDRVVQRFRVCKQYPPNRTSNSYCMRLFGSERFFEFNAALFFYIDKISKAIFFSMLALIDTLNGLTNTTYCEFHPKDWLIMMLSKQDPQRADLIQGHE